MSKDHERTDTLCPDCGDTYCKTCDGSCPAICMKHKSHDAEYTDLLEASREALHGVLFYVDEMAERVLGQPKEMLPDKRLATARSTIKQLDERLGVKAT